jgi:hypothetical protein
MSKQKLDLSRPPKTARDFIAAALRHECPKPDPRAEVALRLLEMVENPSDELYTRLIDAYAEEDMWGALSLLLREAQKGSGE